MPVNLSDWLGDNPATLWAAVALLCLAAELITPSRRMIVWGAVGAVFAGLIALVLPDLWPLQLVAAILVSGALMVVARDLSVDADHPATPIS